VLVRDLPFKECRGNSYWKEVNLGAPVTVHIEVPSDRNPHPEYFGRYWPSLLLPMENAKFLCGEDGLDEFEMQMLLDHLAQEYSLEK
jgi:hypothetical protein